MEDNIIRETKITAIKQLQRVYKDQVLKDFKNAQKQLRNANTDRQIAVAKKNLHKQTLIHDKLLSDIQKIKNTL